LYYDAQIHGHETYFYSSQSTSGMSHILSKHSKHLLKQLKRGSTPCEK
jgi:hypothetical protein